MAMTTKLILFNEALRELGGHPLANLTNANTRLSELSGAFDHAVEFMLAKVEWNFARRRAAMTGVTDSGFPPYTHRYAKPSDYLRKCWVKTAANASHQIDHAEVGAVFYGFEPTALIEYVSDHEDNYDPANWPPHFTRCAVLYLALLTAPKLARAGDDILGRLRGQMQQALDDAEAFEAVFLTNGQIPANRQPVMRKALEFMGQVLVGSVPVMSQADKLRWHMNEAWDHCLKYVLEQGAWNFATRRVTLTGGSEPVPGTIEADLVEGMSVPVPDYEVIEGYSYGSATDTSTADTSLPDMAGYEYGYNLPSDFLHKIWIKADASHDAETPHQFMRDAVYANVQPIVMEYIAWDDDSTDPGEWPASFLETVAAYLALSVSPELVIGTDNKGRARINANDLRQKLDALFLGKLRNAKNRDAIQQYPAQIAPGRFVRARAGAYGSGLRRH